MSSKNAKAYTNIHAQTVRWGWRWGRRTDVREEKEGKKAKENRPQRCRREKRVWRGETDRRENGNIERELKSRIRSRDQWANIPVIMRRETQTEGEMTQTCKDKGNVFVG